MINTEFQFSRLDHAFAHFLVQRSSLEKSKNKSFGRLCAELSFQQSQGHSCIHVNETEQQLILASGLASSDHLSPLVIEQNRLYLQRYWHYENRLALQIKKRLTTTFTDNNLNSILDRYFIDLIDEIDWQREAAKKTVTQAFSIITGGPGTGKTTTVVKILALLQELAAHRNTHLHIALAAPTGKAAMRLQESICLNKNTLPCSEAIKKNIPETVTTIHRLLGPKPPTPYFKHYSDNPLIYDLVVVDEASMIDLALMSKLVDALKPGSRLILLGDKDQLASVESGAVLADLTSSIPDHSFELKKSYRFHGKIRQLADAVNTQAAEEAWQILEQGGEQVSLMNENLIDYITEQYNHYLHLIINNSSYTEIYKAFNQFQVLCAHRHGENGVIEINQKVEEKLFQQNKIGKKGQWYIGRPIMVTQNDIGMMLFNGDIGICLQDKESEKQSVFFLQADGGIKKINPSRMPTHETVFAMTIHKSQGSEFDQCLCILPNQLSPLLSKELLYTAITRTKTQLKIHSSYSIFCQTIKQKVERVGGLFEKIIA